MASSEPRCERCGSTLTGLLGPGLCPACSMALAMSADAGLLTSEADEEDSPLDERNVDRDGPDAAVAVDGDCPASVGPYAVVRRIAEGGMGIVYEARQEHPIARTVAVKVVRLGMGTREVVARFEAERQALAMMDHPNIAKVFDAGATGDGRPYFAMEYVRDAETITAYCDRNRWTVRQRMALFVRACEAVQHAHHKGIIHRDIKPSNVLVTVIDDHPIVKVIDFGIVKALNARLGDQTLVTEQGRLIGTPGYVSPEQLEHGSNDVDTRADVYSLGVLLYELLVGTLPFDADSLRSGSLIQLHRAICRDGPRRTSAAFDAVGKQERGTAAERRATTWHALDRELRSELEWIPLKAMHTDRDLRYRSASELADDVDNYLQGRALIAGPQSKAYRFRKFVANHRTGVSAAVAMTIVVIGFVIGLVLTTRRALLAEDALGGQVVIAKAAAARAEAAKRDAEQKLAVRMVMFGDGMLASHKPGEARDSFFQAWRTAQELNIDDASILARLFGMGFQDVPLMGAYHANGGVGGFSDKGHPNSLILMNEGTTALTCNHTHDLKLWDVRTGRLIRQIETGHGRTISYLAMSADGRTVLSSSFDGKIGVWEVNTWSHREIEGHLVEAYVVAIAPNGHAAAAGDNAGTVMIADLDHLKELSYWSAHSDKAVQALAYSPDGTLLASGGDDGLIKIWDTGTTKLRGTLQPSPGDGGSAIQSLAWSSDGRTIVSGEFDGAVKLWDVGAPAKSRELGRHASKVWRVAWSPDGTSICSGCEDGTVRLWDVATGERKRDFEGHTGEVMGVAFAAGGKLLVAAGDNSQLRVWAVDRNNAFRKLSPTGAKLTAVQISDDGLAVAGSEAGTISVYDVASGRTLRELRGDGHGVTALLWPPSGTSVISGSADGTVNVRDLVDGRVTGGPSPAGGAITGLAFTSDRVIVVRSERRLRLWDLASGVTTDLGDVAGFTCLAARRGSDPLIAATGDGHIQLLQGGAMKTVADLPAEFGRATTVAYAADGRTAVFANKGGGIFAYDVGARHGIETFASGIEDVADLAFLPDGVMLWVIGKGGNAELWDVRQGRSVAQARCSPAGVSAFELSPDGRHAALLGVDGVARACDFSRAAVQHELEERVVAARTALDHVAEPTDGKVWAAFGEWYAFRQKTDWAIDFIRRAESQGASVSRLALARCYWLEGKYAEGLREFDLALERDEVSARYHALCTNALKHRSDPASTAPTASAFR